MANSTIQQHQPLRVPRNWNTQEKALIVQLDEVFDDIYRRFGRLRIEDMGDKFRKRFEDAEGAITEFEIDISGLKTRVSNAEGAIGQLEVRAGEIEVSVGNKYDKISGITINTDGIDLTGNKYIKLNSGTSIDIRTGGTFTVQSGQFSIDANGNASFAGALNAATGTFAGTLSAACITSGTMSANRISGGTMLLGGNNNANGTLIIKDASGAQIGKWDKDGISATKGSFSGRLSSPTGEIGGLTIANEGLSSDELLISSALKAYIAGGMELSERGLIIDYTGFNSYGKERMAFGPAYAIGGSTDWPQLSIHGDSGGLDIVFQTEKQAGNFSETTFECLTSSNDDIKAIIRVNKWTSIGGQGQSYLGGGQLGESTTYRWKYIYVDTINYLTMTQGSSRDIKHDIRDMPSVGERLDALRPVTFVYDEDAEERTRYGLIYEETLEAMPEICSGNEEEKAINYLDMIPMLLKEIQELRTRVSDLEGRI